MKKPLIQTRKQMYEKTRIETRIQMYQKNLAYKCMTKTRIQTRTNV